MATKGKKRKIRFSKVLSEEVGCQLHEDFYLAKARRRKGFSLREKTR
jgi:hypothetical protein